MPELPEVETVIRGLEPFMVDRKIAAVQKRRKDLRIPFTRGIEKRLEGCKIISLQRRAKYIQIILDNADVLVIHLGMSGRISIVPKSMKFRPEKHDHFIITLSSGVRVVYNDPRRFGMIFIVPEADLNAHKAFSRLGPEPLGNQFSGSVLVGRLKNKKTSIKQALLDQRIVVGVGNIYACEALYESLIDPQMPAGIIDENKIEDLVKAVRNVLRRAIKAGGSTLKDYRQADGELGYFQHSFKVYDRENMACPHCTCDIEKTGGIKRIVQSGRSTFYCAEKQK